MLLISNINILSLSRAVILSVCSSYLRSSLQAKSYHSFATFGPFLRLVEFASRPVLLRLRFCLVKKRRVFVCLALNVPERSSEALSHCSLQKKTPYILLLLLHFSRGDHLQFRTSRPDCLWMARVAHFSLEIPTRSLGLPHKHGHLSFFFLSFCSSASKPVLHGCVSRNKI